MSWELCHGFGSPCDSFEVKTVFTPGTEQTLMDACRFTAVEKGGTVFKGVADELELSADSRGCTAVLRGRGLQALLCDSEAESADYQGADLGFILRRHVYPIGIEDVDGEGDSGRKCSMSVASGSSHWKVLSDICEFSLGMKPRFEPNGRLLIDGMRRGRTLRIDAKTAVAGQRLSFERYGAISSALVKNRAAGSSVRVENPRAEALGLRAERVINVPRRTGYDAMRHSGAYQIKKSMEDMLRCTLTLPQPLAAFPGDRIILERSPLGADGEFLVYATRSYAGAGGAGTEIELRRENDVAW